MAAEQGHSSYTSQDTERLEQYHHIRRTGEFPTPMSLSGTILGMFLPMAACNTVGRESNLLVDIALGLSAGVVGYLYDRRRSRAEMAQFLAQLTPNPVDSK